MATQLERREATRNRLIETARSLFAERGYEGTSTGDILAAAGVSRGALYHHFPGKQDLFAAVYERVASEAVAQTTRATARGGPRRRLVRGCLAWLREARRPEVAGLLLDQGPQVLGWKRARDLEARSSLGLVRHSIQAAVAAGELRVPSVELAARLLNAALAECALAVRHREEGVDARTAERAIEQLIAGWAVGVRKNP